MLTVFFLALSWLPETARPAGSRKTRWRWIAPPYGRDALCHHCSSASHRRDGRASSIVATAAWCQPGAPPDLRGQSLQLPWRGFYTSSLWSCWAGATRATNRWHQRNQMRAIYSSMNTSSMCIYIYSICVCWDYCIFEDCLLLNFICSQTHVRSVTQTIQATVGYPHLSTKKATNESYVGFKNAPIYMYIYIALLSVMCPYFV